jgi:hypothetical protein
VPATAAVMANTPSGVSSSTKRVTRTTASSSARSVASRGSLPGTPISARPTAVLNSTTAGTMVLAIAWKGLAGTYISPSAKGSRGSISASL